MQEQQNEAGNSANGKVVDEGNTIPQQEVNTSLAEIVSPSSGNKGLVKTIVEREGRSVELPSSYFPQPKNSFELIKQTVDAMDAMKTLAETLIKSNLCPMKKVEDVQLAIITGNQYGLPFMQSINNIFPINGKPTMSVHLHRGLILQNKIIFSKELDYEPMYEYAKIVETTVEGQLKKVPQIIGIGIAKDIPEGLVLGRKIVDRITRYRFTRMVKQIDGSYEKLTVVSEFKMSDAIQAGLTDKDVWIKYPARMCDARAFSIGSREIASDILFGMYSISELADEANVPYTITDSLEESVIIK